MGHCSRAQLLEEWTRSRAVLSEILGEEVRVDLGYIGDRPFVNNASFGAYAEIVQSPNLRSARRSER